MDRKIVNRLFPTHAQNRQRQLFQKLGTIARTRINACNIANDHSIQLSYEDRSLIEDAAYKLLRLESRIKNEMQNLPNKKRLAKAFGSRG